VKLIFLGTAQDAGVPQVGCACPNCARALGNPRLRRMAPSLGLVSTDGSVVLVDASPHLPEQLPLLTRLAGLNRPLLPDAVLLTHCHWGHYAGLGWLGKEGSARRGTRVFCTGLAASFLQSNRPWKDLVEADYIRLCPVEPGETVDLPSGLRVQALAVPHRADVTDTVAYLLTGEREGSPRVLYAPDLDVLTEGMVRQISQIEVAVVDGTFYSPREHGRSDGADIPHPPMMETIPRLASLATTRKIIFTHFNHTNPVLDPGGAQRRIVETAGFDLAHDGYVLEA